MSRTQRTQNSSLPVTFTSLTIIDIQITSFVRLQALVTQFKTEHFITLDKLHQELAAFRRATIKASEDSAFQLTAATQTMGSLIGQVEANQRSDAQKTDRLLKGIAANFSGEPRNDDAEAVSAFLQLISGYFMECLLTQIPCRGGLYHYEKSFRPVSIYRGRRIMQGLH